MSEIGGRENGIDCELFTAILAETELLQPSKATWIQRWTRERTFFNQTRDEWHHKFMFSRSHFSNRIDESLVMSRRQTQEDCQIATHAKLGRFDSQPVLSVAEFKFHSAKLGEFRGKLLECDLEAQGDLWHRVRARATRPLLKVSSSGHRRKHRETCGRT